MTLRKPAPGSVLWGGPREAGIRHPEPITNMKTKNPTAYPIETGVPIERRNKYPFRLLEVGQSFYVPGGTSSNLASVAQFYRPRKFSTKQTADGVRVWRIA